eukprot:12595353-Alexandrium_andersonii.AAC.1
MPQHAPGDAHGAPKRPGLAAGVLEAVGEQLQDLRQSKNDFQLQRGRADARLQRGPAGPRSRPASRGTT